MTKTILVYEKSNATVRFLKSFFRERKQYAPHFVTKGALLAKKIATLNPAVLIVSSPDGIGEVTIFDVPCPVVALISHDETKGIQAAIKANVDCYLVSPFYKEELDYQLKTLIDRKSLIERLYKDKRDLEALVELTSLASSTLNPKEVLYLVVKKISEVLKVARCSIISIEGDESRYAHVLSTFEDPSINKLRLDLEKYPEIRSALSTKEPVFIHDAQKDPLMAGVRDLIAPLGIRSILVIPIFFREEIIGTLLLRTARSQRVFSKREVDLCVALADAASHALYNAFMYQKLSREKAVLEKLAVTDYLTNIYNIRYFYSRLEEEFSRAVRYQIPLCCMMLDIDYFKQINDRYGHRIGDLILREFAQLVQRHTRKSDIFARYGGEEFILLPQTPLEGALVEAQRLQQMIRGNAFSYLREGEHVTVSFGISSYPNAGITTADDLINQADHALYRAKEGGRDRIVTYPAH